MNQRTEFYKLCILPYRSAQTWQHTKKLLVNLHPLILSIQKKWLTSDNINKPIIRTKNLINGRMTKRAIKSMEIIANYFHCIGVLDGKFGYFIGYQDDIVLCERYFWIVSQAFEVAHEYAIESHNKKAFKQRLRKRKGKPYKELIHGKTFSSTLKDKQVNELNNLINKLLVNTQKKHKEVLLIKKSKLEYIRSWKQSWDK